MSCMMASWVWHLLMHLDAVITVLSITAHALALGLLALAVVLLHEALGVLAGVDGGRVELSMPERSRRGLVGHHTWSQHRCVSRL